MKMELNGQLKTSKSYHTNIRFIQFHCLFKKKTKKIVFLPNSFPTQIKLSLLSCQGIHDSVSQLLIVQKLTKRFSREILKVSLYPPCKDIKREKTNSYILALNTTNIIN